MVWMADGKVWERQLMATINRAFQSREWDELGDGGASLPFGGLSTSHFILLLFLSSIFQTANQLVRIVSPSPYRCDNNP